ncbi:cupin domain-containing protein [Streptomyces sp. NPDC057950]|uniref:cupin domain-containing protein n=1 Tax=Streptomyces sp. NPDC057950 TaxID=3346288 RepID=UPI0036E77897
MRNTVEKTLATTLLERLEAALQDPDPASRQRKAERITAVLDSETGQNPDTGTTPLLICDWADDLGAEGKVQSLGIESVPGPTKVAKTSAATGRSLLSNGHLGADILHVPAGEGFAPHTHPGDHLLFVLAGEGTISVNGQIVPTGPGRAYMVDGSVVHAVGAITDHTILSIGTPHRALDSEDRQSLTAYAALLNPFGSIHCLICDVAAEGGEELESLGCTHSPHRFG